MKQLAGILGAVLLATSLFTSDAYTYEAYALTEEDEAYIQEAREALQDILKDRDVMALVYLSDEFPIRAEAQENSRTVVTVPSGQLVEIRDVVINEEYHAWELVETEVGGMTYSGYIPRENLACSDECFLEWEAEYGMNPAATAVYAVEGQAGSYADIEQFPESYQAALRTLKEQHPNWTFVKQNTGLDWNTAVTNEMQGGRSLVYKTSPDYCKDGAYDNGNWYYATEGILKMYMDPRNALTENSVFQFEQLTYNASYHTEDAVKNFLESTFMNSSGTAPGTDMNYYHIFWSVGSDQNVSPFHLAARVLQEQGNGTSPLISGTYSGYEGYYNYFNVKANGKTNQQIIENGLKYAKERNWYNAYYSILGGVETISVNYIKKGQDTLYLQKFNVNPNGYYALYTHQYMQNIAAPTSEARSVKKQYDGAGALDNTFVFKIPVYENMPDTACPMPTASNSVSLEIPSGYDTSVVYVDGIAYTPSARDGRYTVTLADDNAKCAVVFQYNDQKVPVGMYVWTLQGEDGKYTATKQPELKDILTYHGFSVRVTGKMGIRFKSGISTDLRAQLSGQGVDGYRLKEYGTLLMTNVDRMTYPMVKGGEKVISSMAFGYNPQGVLEDNVYDTVAGRYIYTAVLIGIPAEQYTTEYAFCGYITLTKEGVGDVTIYGPTVAKSMYAVAEQVLNNGTYSQGSKEDQYLRKILSNVR